MLSNYPAMANIAVRDMSVAKAFYEGTLGLTKLREDPSGRTMYFISLPLYADRSILAVS
jgi:predicted enzyme related to lactoylglutathione lyase